MRTRVRTGVAVVVTAGVLGAAGSAASAGATYSWTVQPSFTVAGPTTLAAVTAFNRADAWAVGARTAADGSAQTPLAAHWDGTRWTPVPSPGAGGLNDVAGTGRADVWAVGGTADGASSTIQRWNGTTWTAVPHVAATADSPLTLTAVTAISGRDAWAVGFRGVLDASSGHTQHWDGRTWREVPVPTPAGAVLSLLTSVSDAGPYAVWASGLALTENGFSPYFVRWDGARAGVTSTAISSPSRR